MLYVIQVQSGKEQATRKLVEHFVSSIENHICDEVFIPQREVMRHQKGQWIRVYEILFPGYIFVKTRMPNMLFFELSQVPAFTRLLGSDDAFVPLSTKEVCMISALTGKRHVAEMSTGMIQGDEVRILSGPLRDCDAKIIKIDRHKRAAYVNLSILGRETTIKLGLEVLRKS